MQSKTSYFNKTLFRKNLARFWPLWGGVSALGALVPLAMLTELIHRGGVFDFSGNPLAATASFYQVLASIVPIISLLYAILCALAVWSYLFNARSVSLMHTLPITRKGLFATNVLSGMAMMAIPYAVTGILTILVALLAGMVEPVGVFVTILGVAGESLFYFAAATFAAFCTGNIFAMAALYGIFLSLAYAVEALLTVFFSGFYYGVNPTIQGFAGMLNPTLYLLSHVDVDTTYKEVMTPSGYPTTELDSVTLIGGWVIAVYALIGLLILAVCWALYARRRSESAGDVVAVGWMKPIFRYGVAFCAAISGGMALYTLFWASFQLRERTDALPMAAATAIAGVVGYYIASMLLAKSFKVFKACWRGAAVTAILCAVLCVGTSLDPFGIETRQPDLDRIESACVSLSGNGYCSANVEDPAAIQEIMNAHSAILAQRELLQLNREGWIRDGRWGDESMSFCYAVFDYYLDNGKSVSRHYNFYYSPDPQNQPEGVIPALSQLAASPAIQQDNIFGDLANRENVTLTGGNIGDLYDPVGDSMVDVPLNTAQSRMLREAIERDIQAGRYGRTMFREYNEDVRYCADIYLYYTYDMRDADGDTWQGTGSIRNLGFSVYCTETIAALKELGIPDEDHQLITEEEWEQLQNHWAETYGDRPYYDDDPYYYADGNYSRPIPASASSEVIIGGADSSTEIMVN